MEGSAGVQPLTNLCHKGLVYINNSSVNYSAATAAHVPRKHVITRHGSGQIMVPFDSSETSKKMKKHHFCLGQNIRGFLTQHANYIRIPARGSWRQGSSSGDACNMVYTVDLRLAGPVQIVSIKTTAIGGDICFTASKRNNNVAVFDWAIDCVSQPQAEQKAALSPEPGCGAWANCDTWGVSLYLR